MNPDMRKRLANMEAKFCGGGGLSDFSPASQDAIALQQIRERGALPMVDVGRFDDAVTRVRNIWASLPGAGYGQNEHSMEHLRAAYVAAGGVLA